MLSCVFVALRLGYKVLAQFPNKFSAAFGKAGLPIMPAKRARQDLSAMNACAHGDQTPSKRVRQQTGRRTFDEQVEEIRRQHFDTFTEYQLCILEHEGKVMNTRLGDWKLANPKGRFSVSLVKQFREWYGSAMVQSLVYARGESFKTAHPKVQEAIDDMHSRTNTKKPLGRAALLRFMETHSGSTVH